jgi:hypothetical protein
MFEPKHIAIAFLAGLTFGSLFTLTVVNNAVAPTQNLLNPTNVNTTK